jgi:capsular exopolysaccharide synthesis family protein
MDEPRRRKLSLSDIIRKLHESGRETSGPEQASRGTPAGKPPRDTAPSTATPGDRDHGPRQPNGPQRARTTGRPEPLPHDMPRRSEEEEEEFDVFRYLGVLVRRRVAIVVVLALAALYSLFTYFTAERYYEAHARLLFRPGYQNIVPGEFDAYDHWLKSERLLYTHLELLKSRVVLDQLVEKLGSVVTPAQVTADLTLERGETDGKNNDIIEVSYRHPRAEVARDVVNELCRTYLEYRREVNAQERTRLIFKLEAQIAKLEKELTDKEDAFRLFKEAHGMVKLSEENTIAVSRASNTEVALQQTRLDLMETKKRLQELREQAGRQEVNVLHSMSYDNAYQNRLADLELKLSTLSAEYSPEHFKVRMLKQEIDTLKRAMESDAQSQVARQTTYMKNPIRQSLLSELVQLTVHKSALETRRAAQEKLLDQINSNLVRLPALEQQYVGLQRETVLLEETLKLLKREYEQAKILRDSEELDLRVFELAELPEVAVSPVKLSHVLLGLLVGLVLAVALAFALEYLDQTVKDPAEVEKLLGAPVLGFVPLIEGDHALLEEARELAKSVMEPFRAVRANLKHLISRHNLQTLVVCSAVKGEGKTTLAANLGITFALDGRRVVLVDCDLRRPQMHHLFGLPRERGLAEYLQGSCTLSDILKDTNYEGLRVVTAGALPGNPAELLGTAGFDRIIEELRDAADVVLFDSPALLPVSDVMTIAPKMDAAVFVIRTLWTPAKAAKQAIAQLKRIGTSIAGGIINGVSHAKGYYPYYYGYYTYYRYRYAYDYGEAGDEGSLRKLGLQIESGLRERTRDVRYLLPRLVARAAAFVHSCARRPLFWLLLVLVAALVFVEKRLRPEETDLMPGGIRLTEEDLTAGPLETPQAVRVEHGASSSRTPHAQLEESHRRWLASFTRGDTALLRRLYDSGRLQVEHGGTSDEDRAAWEFALSAGGPDGILCDSARVVSVELPRATTEAAFTRSDSTGFHVLSTWLRADGVWRIVKQEYGELERHGSTE